jgi:hypothetical protein
MTVAYNDFLKIGQLRDSLTRAHDAIDLARGQRDTAEAKADRLEGHNRELRRIGDQMAALVRDLVETDNPTLDCVAAAGLVVEWRNVQ